MIDLQLNSVGSRLIFVWPQKESLGQKITNILQPALHTVLSILMCAGAMHLWPGMFLPTELPETGIKIAPPLRCNIIEPRWNDTSDHLS